MRIAICSLDFGGSTTSLIEAYLKKGIDVDYYILASPFKRTSYESFELHERPFLCQIKEVRNLEVGLLRFAKYKRTDRFRAYLVGVLEIYDSRKRTVTNLLMKIFLRSLTQKISAQRYDFVNVIGQIQLTSELSILLKKREVKVIHSLHEVCKNHLEGALVHPCVLPLIKNEICINVFSQKSADDLYRLTHYSKEKISIIPFNLFNGYLEYSGTEVVKELEDIEDYVLFYGFIQPYKGLEVLYDAVTKHLSDDNIKIVVAGRGNDAILQKMKNDKHFVLVNQWLSNSVLVSLIKRCKCVVCPYLSSSQTGITQTVFNFDKPIIASNVPAFQTTIIDRETGMLVPVNEAKCLANAIEEIFSSAKLYNYLCSNIKSYRIKLSGVCWDSIVDKYVQLSKNL